MKTYMECVPCQVRQAYEASGFATDDGALRESILREALRMIAEVRMDQSPPHMATAIHRMIRERTGCADPYRAMKDRFNLLALDLLGEMKERARSFARPFEAAVRLAIAGNIIDFGAPGTPGEKGLRDTIEQALSCALFGPPPDSLREAAERAGSILVLGDNAGEIVFDRLLLEALPAGKCAYAVKGAPVINDATRDDAREAGLADLAEVIDNGSDAPGTVLEWCSPGFQRRFADADVVIAKGQGNYETLSGAARPNLFFLLKAKCPVVARHIGCRIGDFVIQCSNGLVKPLATHQGETDL